MKKFLIPVLAVAFLTVTACAPDADADADADAMNDAPGAPAGTPATTLARPGMYTLSDAEGGFADDMQPGDAYELNLRDDGTWTTTKNGAPFASGTSVRFGEEVTVSYETGPCAGTEARLRSTPTEASITQTKLEADCDEVPESAVWTWVGDHTEDGAGEM